jgi:hypothetical protein
LRRRRRKDEEKPERVMLFDFNDSGEPNDGKVPDTHFRMRCGGRKKKMKKDFAGYEKRCTLVSLDQ